MLFALHARAIAQSLHDTNGRFLPLYFQMPQIGENVWFHPALVYFTAIFLKLLPLSEWTVRLPTVCIGIVNIILIYKIALHVFGSEGYGLVAGALMALTPAHFIHSRLAMDYLYPVPFLLIWLWCLVRFEHESNPRLIFAACLALGVGLYSYIGALLLMPVYGAMTVVFLLHKYRRMHQTVLWAAAGFFLPLALLIFWVPRYPHFFEETIVRYGVPLNGKLHALRGFFTSSNLEQDLALYWNFHSPVYLFFRGSSNWVDSTRRAGVFLVPMGTLLVAGVADFVIGPRTRISWLVFAGVLTAPLGAVFVGESLAVQRELELLPFAVLLAVFGVRRLATSANRASRWLCYAMLALMPLQFADFCSDYFTAYRLNSIAWFGPKLEGALTCILGEERERGSAPTVYLSRAIPYGRAHWDFQLAKSNREDLLAQTFLFDAQTTIASIPPGSIVIEPLADGVPLDHLVNSLGLERIGVLTKPDGGPTFWLLRRTG